MGKGKRARRLVTAIELAAALGCNRHTIGKWQGEGLPVAQRGGGGRASRYDVEACRAWQQARADNANADPLDLIRGRARREKAQADLIEQLHATRAGLLLPVDEVVRKWTDEITAARSVILSSYLAAADRVYRAGTVGGLAAVERALRDLANDVLRELAEPAPKKKRGAA